MIMIIMIIILILAIFQPGLHSADEPCSRELHKTQVGQGSPYWSRKVLLINKLSLHCYYNLEKENHCYTTSKKKIIVIQP